LTKTLIIFDIDGTLVTSDSRDSKAFAESYQEYFDKDFYSIDWRKYEHVTDHTIFHSVYRDHFGHPCSVEDMHGFQDHYINKLTTNRQENPDHYREIAGSRAILDALHTDERYILGIGTGGWKRPQLIKLAHVGISVDYIYDSYADDKPTREDILQESIDLARQDHEVTHTVYLGDAIWDLHTTRNMDIPLIGVRHNGDHEFFIDKGIKNVITDYQDVAGFMRMVELIAERTT
jgi:phosphoglycolate phosphatase-like HAD superfamily hydrolase